MAAGGGAGAGTSGDGDPADLFRAAYRTLAPQVRGYARRQLPEDLADDVVAETFLVLWRRWDELDLPGDAVRPWVFGVARNKIRHAREQHGRATASLLRVAAMEPTRAAPADPADELAGADRTRELLGTLPPAEAEAMALTVWAGLSPSEAAQALGVSLTALTSRLSRARTRLAAVVEQRAGTDDERGER